MYVRGVVTQGHVLAWTTRPAQAAPRRLPPHRLSLSLSPCCRRRHTALTWGWRAPWGPQCHVKDNLKTQALSQTRFGPRRVPGPSDLITEEKATVGHEPSTLTHGAPAGWDSRCPREVLRGKRPW